MSKTPKEIKKRHSGLQLDRSIIDKMWKLYQDGKSMNFIGKQLKIASSTVGRYRDRENWDQRVDDIRKKAIQKVDAHAVSTQSRQLNLARLLQARGMNRVRTLSDEDISANDARQFIKDGIILERAITGEGEREIQVTIKLPAGLEDL